MLQNGTHSFQLGMRTVLNAVMNLRVGAFCKLAGETWLLKDGFSYLFIYLFSNYDA
jgi:hypothetical protein